MTNEEVAFLGLHHVALPFPGTPQDVASARQFYGTLLGLQELDVPDAMVGVLWFAVGRLQELHLFTAPAVDGPPSTRHPCLRVEGLDVLRQRLAGAGAEVIDPQGADIPGRQRFFVMDPFGNAVEFAEFESGRV